MSALGFLGLIVVGIILLVRKIKSKKTGVKAMTMTLCALLCIFATMFLTTLFVEASSEDTSNMISKLDYDEVVAERDKLLEEANKAQETEKTNEPEKQITPILNKEIVFENGATATFMLHKESFEIKGVIHANVKGESANDDMNQVYALAYGMELLDIENYSLVASSDNNEDTLIFLTCTDGEYLVPVCPEEYRKVEFSVDMMPIGIVADTLGIKTDLSLEEPTVKNETEQYTLVYEDDYVTISFVGCEYGKQFGKQIEQLVFFVDNKSDYPLTFQADTFALDGISLGYSSGSDEIAAKSKGKIRFETNEAFPSMTPSTITGTIKVIDWDQTLFGELSYNASFTNVAVK